MSAITLHYFDGYGRGEVARMIMHHHGTRFTDHRVQFSEWPSLKASGLGEFDELPVLEIDGLKLAESRSINRYLAQKLGYGTTNLYDEYLVESLCDLREDILKFFSTLIFNKDMEGLEREMNSSMVEWLKIIEKRLEANNMGRGWFVGNRITRVDFEIFQTIHDYMLKDEHGAKYSGILATHAPKLKGFCDRFKESSMSFKTYLQSRPKAFF